MLIPNDGALCYVNGRSVCQPMVLNTGSRVILGKNHVFRFTHPEQGQVAVTARGRERDVVYPHALYDFDR